MNSGHACQEHKRRPVAFHDAEMTDNVEAERDRLDCYQILGVVSADGLNDLDNGLQAIVAAAQGGRFASGHFDLLHSLLPSSLTEALSEHDEAGSVALVRHIALYVHDVALRAAGAGWVLAEQRGVLYPDVVEASDQAWWLANQASVVAAGARAFHEQSSLGQPAGVARFCTAQAWAETVLLTGLYRTAVSARRAARCWAWLFALLHSHAQALRDTRAGTGMLGALGTAELPCGPQGQL